MDSKPVDEMKYRDGDSDLAYPQNSSDLEIRRDYELLTCIYLI